LKVDRPCKGDYKRWIKYSTLKKPTFWAICVDAAAFCVKLLVAAIAQHVIPHRLTLNIFTEQMFYSAVWALERMTYVIFVVDTHKGVSASDHGRGAFRAQH
jgi:hypothetical protein